MALDPVPFIIGGGTEHSPEVVRQAMYDATSGAEGISSPGAYKVQAQSTPNGTVRVAPGGATLLNKYPGGAGQSYTGVRNASQTSVPVVATGSTGGRTDAVILRVLDPQYEGQPPADPNAFQYTRLEILRGVTAGLKTIGQLSLAYPAILLAKLTIPASTATITSGMITDLREMANPRKDVVIRARALTAINTETLTSTTTEYFPNAGGEQTISIPSWATRAIIEASWIQIREPGGNSWGECWVEFGPYKSAGVRQHATQRFGWNTHSGADVARGIWMVADDQAIPAAIRGTDQFFIMKARIQGSSNNAARPQLDGYSGVSLRVTFLEEADRSTS